MLIPDPSNCVTGCDTVLTSAGWCDAAGNPVTALYQIDCSTGVLSVQFVDPGTGVFVVPVLPLRACAGSDDFEQLAICDMDPATGSVLGVYLVRTVFDPDTGTVTTTLVDVATGLPYVPTGVPRFCGDGVTVTTNLICVQDLTVLPTINTFQALLHTQHLGGNVVAQYLTALDGVNTPIPNWGTTVVFSTGCVDGPVTAEQCMRAVANGAGFNTGDILLYRIVSSYQQIISSGHLRVWVNRTQAPTSAFFVEQDGQVLFGVEPTAAEVVPCETVEPAALEVLGCAPIPAVADITFTIADDTTLTWDMVFPSPVVTTWTYTFTSPTATAVLPPGLPGSDPDWSSNPGLPFTFPLGPVVLGAPSNDQWFVFQLANGWEVWVFLPMSVLGAGGPFFVPVFSSADSPIGFMPTSIVNGPNGIPATIPAGPVATTVKIVQERQIDGSYAIAHVYHTDAAGGLVELADRTGLTIGECPPVTAAADRVALEPSGASIGNGVHAGTFGPDGATWVTTGARSVTVVARQGSTGDATGVSGNFVLVQFPTGQMVMLKGEAFTWAVEDGNSLDQMTVTCFGDSAAAVIQVKG